MQPPFIPADIIQRRYLIDAFGQKKWLDEAETSESYVNLATHHKVRVLRQTDDFAWSTYPDKRGESQSGFLAAFGWRPKHLALKIINCRQFPTRRFSIERAKVWTDYFIRSTAWTKWWESESEFLFPSHADGMRWRSRPPFVQVYTKQALRSNTDLACGRSEELLLLLQVLPLGCQGLLLCVLLTPQVAGRTQTVAHCYTYVTRNSQAKLQQWYLEVEHSVSAIIKNKTPWLYNLWSRNSYKTW